MAATDVQIRIPDMKCEGCAERVTRVLERQEGIRSADVSFDEKRSIFMLASPDVEVGGCLPPSSRPFTRRTPHNSNSSEQYPP